MTRIFDDNGDSIPVTVLSVSEHKVAQIKTVENEGYNSIQISYGLKKPSKINKALKGHFAKAQIEAGQGLFEIKGDEGLNLSIGDTIDIDLIKETEYVDVRAVSKGKGFAGTVKRHNFATQDATHGNSLSHRAPGSIGQNQTPGRVFKGKKMAGHMGAKKVTCQSLKVAKVDIEKKLLLIKGAVPGFVGCEVFVSPAVKKSSRGA